MAGEPILVKVKNATVPIYCGTNRGKPLYTVVFHTPDRRIRLNFRDLSDAQRRAKSEAEKLSRREPEAAKLTDKDAATYTASLDAIRPTGKRLEVIASEAADALGILKGKGSLIEAARFYVRQHVDLPPKQVSAIVQEMLEAKRKDGGSPLYLRDLTIRLGKFEAKFGGAYIGNITRREIEDWLRALPGSGRNRNNSGKCLTTLFRFAKARGYLARDRLTEADDLPRAKTVDGEIGILTPEEMGKLLNAAEQRAIPFLVIGAFAGLRHEELRRLEWRDVNFAEGHITVSGAKSKTASRRIVPMPENLRAWLAPYRGASGFVAPPIRMTDVLLSLARSCGFLWKRNALRHSYVSYRLQVIKNVAEVALECGNSPEMIFKNYRELVTEKQAKTWFAIMPKRAKNVVSLPRSA